MVFDDIVPGVSALKPDPKNGRISNSGVGLRRADPAPIIASPPAAARREPLRICQVLPYDIAERGGVKHHAVQLARALREHGDQVTIIGPSTLPYSESHVVAFVGAANIPGNGSDNRLGLFVSPWQVREFFRRNSFDVVHVHEPHLPFLSHWAVRFTPASAHVATFHAYWGRPNPAWLGLSRLSALRQAAAFHGSTAVSEEAASYAQLSWSQPITIIPNGVPIDVFTPPAGPRRPGPLRLLFVGRLGDARKGWEQIYRAFLDLRAQGLQCTLDAVGELGRAKPPEPAPGLTYHGAVPMQTLIEQYRNCDVFVAPATGQESFGIVLLEAMATARPVICSDIPGYRRAASPDGAILVPPGDVPALERAIAQFAAQPERWQGMGDANRARARLFSWDAIAARVRDLYCRSMNLARGEAEHMASQSLPARASASVAPHR